MKNIQLVTAGIFICLSATLNAADNVAAQAFTEEMAQRVLAAPVQPAKGNSGADMKNGETTVSQCSYSLKNGDLSPAAVSLMLRRAPSASEAKTIFLSSKKIYSGETVAGLGDDAYRTAAPAQLNVLKGRNWLIISAGAFPKADQALQETAAREILKNIQD